MRERVRDRARHLVEPVGWLRALLRLEALKRRRLDLGGLHVERYVEPDGAGAPGAGLVQGLVDMVGDGPGIGHGGRMLGDARHDVDDADLLVALLPHPAVALQVGRLGLPGDEQDRRRLEPSGGASRHGVRRPRTRRHAHGPYALRYPRIGLGSEGAGLLVQKRHVLEPLRASERVHQVHRSAAGEHEDMPHPRIGDPVPYVV